MVKERVRAPQGVPTWGFLAASFFACLVVLGPLAFGGSWLPFPVQLALALGTTLLWLPGVRQPVYSPWFVVASTLPIALLTWTGGSPAFFVILALSASRVAFASSVPESVIYAALAGLVIAGRAIVGGHDTDLLVWDTYVVLAAVVGFAMQRQVMLVEKSRERTVQHARVAAIEERRRIARDVHDVLAHTLTILMVHLNSARLSVHDDPDATAEVLDEVARYGRQCLEEIRRTVGLLSEKPTTADGPIEAAEAIEALVAVYRNAGVDVQLMLDVEMGRMGLLAQPTSIWSAGYRIVQESLANATKHAPGASIDVRIRIDDEGLHIVCANVVTPGVVKLELPKGGNGITGMQERVAGLDGKFIAGLDGPNWTVRADLPLSSGDADARRSESLGRAS